MLATALHQRMRDRRNPAPGGLRMQILLVWLVAAVAAVPTASVNDRLTSSPSVMVRAVIDGDTIDVTTIGRVNLLGIRAPQMGGRLDLGAPFARAARERLAALVLRRWVRLEGEGHTAGVSGRRVVYVVRDDGLFVNAVLVREGLASVGARPALARRDELERAEAEARLFRRGIWGNASPDLATSYTRRSKARRPRSKPRTTPKAPRTRPKSPKS
jgi:endonuclease YncB( thermonuclease family)